MLECRACVLRCLRAVAGDGVYVSRTPPPLILTPRIAAPFRERRRLHVATAVAPPEGDALSALEVAGNRGKPVSKGKSLAAKQENALKKELVYLDDPVKLADHVLYTLRKEEYDKALELCRLASKTKQCIVAWNHVIDRMMRAGKINEAIKVYNEMKKRGQYPDSYTYSQLLSGFVQLDPSGREPVVREEHVSKTLAIYYSMTSPTSRVKPSIIHTNAALRVCSIAGDMDAMWSVASKIPEKGSGAADEITYSILLGGIRHGAFGHSTDNPVTMDGSPNWKLEDVDVERLQALRQKAVNEGRRIWDEVIQKWRGGVLSIDETLVVEMAHLLLFGNRMEDWDDVLNLVRQTTNIDRLVAPLTSPERKTGHVPLQDQIEAQTNVEDEEGWIPTPAANTFKAVMPLEPLSGDRARKSLAYVQPGNGILNVILQACTQMRIPKTAYDYWNLLTTKHGVRPDRNNFKEMLKLLRFNRSSSRAVEIVKQMHSEHKIVAVGSTYRMAMSVLQRDWKNINIMKNALALIDDMWAHLHEPDWNTLTNFLDLAAQQSRSSKLLLALDHVKHFANMAPRFADGEYEHSRHPNDFLRQIVRVIDTARFPDYLHFRFNEHSRRATELIKNRPRKSRRGSAFATHSPDESSDTLEQGEPKGQFVAHPSHLHQLRYTGLIRPHQARKEDWAYSRTRRRSERWSVDG